MYARNTTVSVDRSRAEIETILGRYGADSFMSGWDSDRAVIGFRCNGRVVRFVLPMPKPTDEAFRQTPSGRLRYPGARADRMAARDYEQEVRRRWRALALALKAKLEAVATGIATFESEFLAHIVVPGTGQTVGSLVTPRLREAYETGRTVALLPEGTL